MHSFLIRNCQLQRHNVGATDIQSTRKHLCVSSSELFRSFWNSSVWKTSSPTSYAFIHSLGLPWWLSGKESTYQCRSLGRYGSIPELGRSPGRGNGNALQYSCLGNPMAREAWTATVHGAAQSGTGLSDYACRHTRFQPFLVQATSKL